MNLPLLVIPIILHRKLVKYGYDPSCSKLHKSLISLLVSLGLEKSWVIYEEIQKVEMEAGSLVP